MSGGRLFGLARRRALVSAATLAVAVLSSPAVSSVAAVSAAGPGPCGALTYDPTDLPDYDHVVVLMDENLSYAQLQQSTAAPYLKSLASACGSESNMHAATHPSQPNYMAATSGVATVLGTHTANNNVFHQAQVTGDSWRGYNESMPSACAANTGSAPTYKSGHSPAFWYTDLRSPTNTCKRNDLSMTALNADIAADTLPTYAWVTPNLCDDMHWAAACGYPQTSRVAVGDAWLSQLVPRLTAMPSYQNGRTLIIVTFDEGGEGGTKGADCTDPDYYPAHPDCKIATVVVSPFITPGATDRTDQNLYSLLATTEDILGYARLGRAVGQPSMRPGLGF
jgi:phosphatidylinositol-3-phosphatase